MATARPGAAASAYTYTISARSCSSSGLSFNARQVEHGLSGTQRFKQVAQLQRRSGSRWVAATSRQTVFSVKFGNTGASKAFNRHWVGSHSTAGHYRIVWQGYWLNGRNVVLAHSPQVVGVSC